MEIVHSRCAGMDVSKRDAKVCVRVAGRGRRKTAETVTTWASTTNAILALREQLIAEQVSLVVMEATGAYPRSVDWPGWSALLVKLILVWLGGRAGAAGLPSVSTVVVLGFGPFGPVGRVQAGTGGGRPSPRTRSNRVSQGLAQGQCAGRWSTGLPWGRAIRAGMVMMVRRRVAPRAMD